MPAVSHISNIPPSQVGQEAVAFAEKMANDVVEALEVFTESKHVEVQERAVLAKTMLSQCRLCRKTFQKQQQQQQEEEEEQAADANDPGGVVKSDESPDEEPLLEFVATRVMLDEAILVVGPMFEEPLRPVRGGV